MTTPGFYDDGHGQRRWWSGKEWTGHYDPDHVVTDEVRQRNLNAAVGNWVSRGWTIEFNDGTRAVLSQRVRMSLVLNLIGVVVTGGLWLIYVLVRIASPRYARRTLTVHPNGLVQ